MKLAGIVISLSVLLGCIAIQAPLIEEPVAITPDCGASSYQYLLGKNAQTLDGIKAMPEDTRIIFPGTITTKDYRLDRMNIHINKSKIIEKIICG